MGKKIRNIIFCVLLLLYIVFFGNIIEKESVYTPVWILDRDSPAVSSTENSEWVPFAYDGIFGYLDMDGFLRYRDRMFYDVAVGRDVFINYSKLPDTLVLQNRRGEIIESLDVQGYPFFMENRLFVLSVDRLSLEEFDAAGNSLWVRSFSALITSADVADDLLLVGLLNGELLLLSDKGEVIYSVKPGGSGVQIIYGCALARGGERIAAISGVDPQKLIFIEKKNDVYRIEDRYTFPEDFRSSVFLDFSPDGNVLLLSIKDRTFLYSVQENFMEEMNPGGGLEGFRLADPGSLSCFLLEEQGYNHLTVRDIGGAFQEDLPLPPGEGFLAVEDNTMVLGVDRSIVRIDREVR